MSRRQRQARPTRSFAAVACGYESSISCGGLPALLPTQRAAARTKEGAVLTPLRVSIGRTPTRIALVHRQPLCTARASARVLSSRPP